ncbi:gliding motility-associated C-terminal domain-containing protein [Neolewinella agarilytica]|uniref:Gliding motility-associated C-terminal domain-containing protein n=2 Tax=Neolewinella agarilytica TaxID=478744 RepID=A0A1H9EJ31_9BACT|nr:gliding motility-associated C-terminal domain-containing protein [Neolewinella agarilytica]
MNMKFSLITLMLLLYTSLAYGQTFDLTVFDQPEKYELSVDGEQEIILRIGGLSVGEPYGIQLHNQPRNFLFDFGTFPEGTDRLSPGFLSGVAMEESISVCVSELLDGPGTLTLTLRKNNLFSRVKSSASTFEVANSNNLDSMLNIVFRNESCFDLFPNSITSGVRTLGDGRRVMQTGVFSGGVDAFDMENGIIMSTGAVTDAVGPNASSPRSVNYVGINNTIDSDANSLIPPNFCSQGPNDPPCYSDVAILSFDFIPTTDTISFNYIFFSEEYCLALDGGFAADAFAFFLEGPNVLPNGRQNIARLPSGEVVSSRTMNHIETPSIFRDNSFNSFSPCTNNPNDPIAQQQTAYDGFSRKLNVKAAVTPCERHTLKLMVLDALDANLDSGILLEAGSFTAGLISDPEPSVQGIAGAINPVEGCDTASITFSRLFSDTSDIAQPLFVNYNLITTGGGLNLADNGLDFDLPPSPFVIPPGDTSGTLRIPILADALAAEGVEAFIIKYDGTCNCDQNRDTFYIQDAVNLEVDLTPDQTLCAGDDLILEADVSGGKPRYTYQWPNGLDTSRVTYTSTGRDTTIQFVVTDSCGLMGTGAINIMAPAVSAATAGDFSLCNDPIATVPLDVEGTPPFNVRLRIDSSDTIREVDYTVTQDTSFTFDYPATISLVEVTDDSGCGGSATGRAVIRAADLTVTPLLTDPDCNTSTGNITLTVAGGNANHTFSWMDDAGQTGPNRSNLPVGSYTVTIAPVSDPSCAENFTYILNPPTALVIDSIDYSLPDCPGETIILSPIVSGGTAPYEFFWPDSLSMDSLLSITTQTGRRVYPVVVTDNCGVEVTDSVVIDLPVFSVELSGRYSLCNTDPVQVPFTVSGPAGTYAVEVQTDSSGLSQLDTLMLTVGVTDVLFSTPATITVISIRNAADCSGEIVDGQATVVDPDLRFNPTVDQVRCRGEATGSILLTAPANVPVTFAWSDGGNTSGNRTGLSAGSYTVTISDAMDASCFIDTTFNITEPAALTVALANGNLSCPLAADTIIPTVMGGTPPYTFLWRDSLTTDSLLPVSVGGGNTTYTVEVTDACMTTSTAFISYSFEDVRASVGGTYGVCNPPFNVDVPFALSGSTSYELDILENGVPRTLSLTGNTTINYNTATTIELVEVRGADGCVGLVNGTARVIDSDFMVTSATTNVSCAGGSDGALDLTVNGDPTAYTYDWATPGLSGANPTGLPAGTYPVRITDLSPSACFFDTFFVVAEPDMLLSAEVTALPNCPGELLDIAVSVTGGSLPYSFNWENGASSDSVYQITTLPGLTRYPVVVTDNCGLVANDTVTVILEDVQAAISGNYSICNAPFNVDVPLTLSGSNRYEVTLRENGIDRTFIALGDTLLNYNSVATIQLISVFGLGSCPGAAGGIANVTDATFSVVPTVTDVACAGLPEGAISVVVNNNNAAYTFSWDRAGLSGPSIDNLTSGTYSLTVTETAATACLWDTTFTILEPASVISLLQDSSRNETCSALAYASATYTGGTGQLTYRWSNGTMGNVLGDVAAGAYDLTISDENSCEIVRSFNLQDRTVTVLSTISASEPELSCNQTSLELSAQQNTQAVRWQWTDQDQNNLGTDRTISVSAPGRYFVEVFDPASNCTALDSIDIGQSADLIDLVLPTISPLTCTDQIIDITVSHPDYTDSVRYEWRLNGGSIIGTSATLPSVSTPGNYEVTVIREDNGCPTVATTEVAIDQDPPTVSNPTPQVVLNCRLPDVAVFITANGPYRFAWSTANGNFTAPLTEPGTRVDRPGIYSVLVTDTLNGCTTTASVEVIQNGVTLTPLAGNDQPLICDGAGTLLNGNFSPRLAGSTGRWYAPDGRVISESTRAFAQEAGPFVFEAIHPESGCSSFDTVMVVSEAPTAVSYSIQQPPCPEVGGRIFVSGVTGMHPPYEFSSPTGVTEPFGTGLRGLPEGSNVLVVTDALGCELRDTFLIFASGEFTGSAEDVSVQLGEEAILGVETNRGDGALVQWEWSNLPDSTACLTCPEPRVNSLESFVALLTVADSNGCVLELRQNVFVTEQELVYMPNAFSPNNGDGVNDIYTVFGNPEFVTNVSAFRIFDRWGNLVFNNENFMVNDPNEGWDGMNAGQKAPAAVYVFSVEVEYYDKRTEVIQGSFTLVR